MDAKKSKNPWIKVIIAIAVIAGLYFLFQSLNLDFSDVTVDTAKDKIRSFGIWGPIVYIGFYVIRPLILFPASILSASAGAIWGLKGLIYLLIAANLSSTAEFLFARYVARDGVSRLVKGKMDGIDRAIEKRGFITVLLIRLIPNVAWDIQNLSLGLTRVTFRDYFIATFLGILPGSFALVYFGDSFISVVTNPANFWKILLAFALFGAIYFLQDKLRSKKREVIEKAKT